MTDLITFSAEDRAFLQQPMIARMSVIDSKGYPHTLPVWYMLDDDTLLITTSENTRKIDFIRANPKGGMQIGGEPAHNGRAYVLKGTFTIEPDADYAVLKRITYHYEPRDRADELLKEWAQGVSLVLRFTPHMKIHFNV